MYIGIYAKTLHILKNPNINILKKSHFALIELIKFIFLIRIKNIQFFIRTKKVLSEIRCV